jgi:hypothetical protein
MTSAKNMIERIYAGASPTFPFGVFGGSSSLTARAHVQSERNLQYEMKVKSVALRAVDFEKGKPGLITKSSKKYKGARDTKNTITCKRNKTNSFQLLR